MGSDFVQYFGDMICTKTSSEKKAVSNEKFKREVPKAPAELDLAALF